MTNAYPLRSSILLTNASFGFSFLRDAPSEERKRSIDFHIESDDYFGTLATVLGLVSDSLQNNSNIAKKRLTDLRDELSYLQGRYKIEQKD